MTAATAFRPWRDWYPVNFGQPENYRMINRWNSYATSTCGSNNSLKYGHSSLNVKNSIGTLPTKYQGTGSIDYFFLWDCLVPAGGSLDPYCLEQTRYREIISQGTAYNSGGTTLEHWSRGSSISYEVYYNSGYFGGAGNCSEHFIDSTGKTQAYLESATNKKPWTLKLPTKVNQYYVSEPVCTIVYKSYNQAPTATINGTHQDNIIDGRKDSAEGASLWQTGNWITITSVLKESVDSAGLPIVRADNTYFTDNTVHDDYLNRYCTQNPSDTLHCEYINPGNQSLGRQGLTYSKDGKTYRAFSFETYWMRKTASTGKYARFGTITDKYGLGSFTFNGMPEEWDKVKNNHTCDSANTAQNQEWTMESCSVSSNFTVSGCTTIN